MGGCCAAGSSSKYAKSPGSDKSKDAATPNYSGTASSSSLPCPACRLTQTVPANTRIFACSHCRHVLVNPLARPEQPWAEWIVDSAPEPTVHAGPRPRVGSKVRLSPCCLYYDPQCQSLGCLDSLAEEGTLTADNGLSGPEARPLEVESRDQRFHFKLGCIEEAEVVRWHDELFRHFARAGGDAMDKQKLLFAAPEFVEYMKVTTTEEGDVDVYAHLCKALGVHPSQGLTSGDFRRMYSEFEGDLHEDHQLVCGGSRPNKAYQGGADIKGSSNDTAEEENEDNGT